MPIPANGSSYSLNPATNTTSRAARQGATAISITPGFIPLLQPTYTTMYTSTGSVKPKPAVVDPKLGAGKSVTQPQQGQATNVQLFLNDYQTSKNPNPAVTVATPVLTQSVSATAVIAGPVKLITVNDKLTTQTSTTQFVQPPNINDYIFNLSPHSWSLPLAPQRVDHRSFKKNNKANGATLADVVGTNKNPTSTPTGKLRRGRIMWHASATDVQYTNSNGGTTQAATGKARQIGFQFLWNPENFQTQVTLNPDVTPSIQDRFVGVAGAFPGTESIAITIRIDRTNDFACFAHLGSRELDPKTGRYRDKQWNARFGKFYKPHKLGVSTDALIEQQLKELYEMGTIADIEFLYQAVNGPNANYMKGGWKNSLGRVTSDIGFLSATLVKFEIGPLNYLGYINAINVQHLAFTQDMKPIRSDVSIQANLLASVGLAEAQ